MMVQQEQLTKTRAREQLVLEDQIFNLAPTSKYLKDKKSLSKLAASPNHKEHLETIEIEQEILHIIANCHSIEEAEEALLLELGRTYASQKQNIGEVLEQIQPLERTARGFKAMCEIAGDSMGKITICNAAPEDMGDLEDTHLFDISDEYLEEQFYELRLTNSPYLHIILDYLGSKAAVKKMAQTALKTGAMLLAPFKDTNSLTELIDEADDLQFAGIEPEMATTIMAAMPLVARPAYKGIEKQPFVIPSVGVLAGLMMKAPLAQCAAGFQFGKVSGFSTLFKCNRKHGAILSKKYGFVSAGMAEGDTIFLGNRSLNNGDDPEATNYSTFRTKLFIEKEIADYLNQEAYINMTQTEIDRISRNITKYLNRKMAEKAIKGFGKVIVFQDLEEPENVQVAVRLKTNFPGVYFEIRLLGQKDEEEGTYKWLLEQAQLAQVENN